MKKRLSPIAWLSILCGVLPMVIVHAEPRTQNNIPALLQFAEQYQQRSQPKQVLPQANEPAKPATSKNQHQEQPKLKVSVRHINSWQTKDAELQRQIATIAELKQQLTTLRELQQKQQKTTKMPSLDWQGIALLAKNLRQAVALTPTEQQTVALLKQAEQQRAQLSTLKSQYNDLQQQLQQARTETERQVAESSNALALLRKNSEAKIAGLQKNLTAMQAYSVPQLNTEMLKKAKNRQSYAAGVSLGEEILQMQAEHARWGVQTDKQLILAGIHDTFTGKQHLTDNELNAVLANTEKELTTAREKSLASQSKNNSEYLAKFKRDKQAKQASSGFWYKIDYAGDTAITAGASVDVVVKEMLTNGTVIQDMAANGATLSQPVADFPPLFKEAISLLKNHGSMTLVAPPELAYGEKGYPPKVPPNATMVYQLRIAEMYPAK
ncbi:FKBP-type peptidyl-prolyl cis-trans isomerase [Serratia rubidaea]|uniref:peptidylprolyl isomerase n=2 Tax=Serratia rubidaea TaxID=61652 RepID=A0ABS0MFZ4_SERRU|nr:FKBP-type peptidyl-prolyl cis-trans isomerase [Serratia rubidaea]